MRHSHFLFEVGSLTKVQEIAELSEFFLILSPDKNFFFSKSAGFYNWMQQSQLSRNGIKLAFVFHITVRTGQKRYPNVSSTLLRVSVSFIGWMPSDIKG